MSDHRSVDELSLEELEELVQQRRRIERARRFAENGEGQRFRPVTVMPKEETRTLPRLKARTLRDRILLAVEIVAMVALVVIIAGSLFNLQTLNKEVLQALTVTPPAYSNPTGLELPGASFPPLKESSELPGGSFPPESAPPALGIRLQSVAAIPVPTPGPRSPTRIVIPTINLDWPVVEGDGWDELKQAIGHRVGSANPGERGNLVLSGHNDVYGEPFRELDKLEPGKEVMVYAGANAFRYVVKAKRVVLPTDMSVLVSSKNPVITLITCTPYRIDTHRLIVQGELAP